MSGKMMRLLSVYFIASALVLVVGCQNDATSGAAIGSLAGAGIGQLAGRHTESTLVGAAVGGGVGYIIGNESERAKAAQERRALTDEINSVTVYVTNSNGSIVPVRLRKCGPGYLGTRGEYYAKLPTSDQLRPVYGF